MACGWCSRELGPGRRDRRYCSDRCRQAAWRFASQVATAEAADRPLRLAYADPPYPGLAARYYGHDPRCAEVSFLELASVLEAYDGWALSTSATALPQAVSVLQVLGIRIAAWFRGSRPGSTRGPRASWEPVIYHSARSVVFAGWCDDSLIRVARPRLTDPARVVGQKPAAFASWLFGLLGARGGDTLDDLYPASGGVGRAWELFQSSPSAAEDVSVSLSPA